jgi:hypothetical protein
MDEQVGTKIGQWLARRVKWSSLAGDGWSERVRTTTFALLGLTAAAGLGLVAIFSQQGWPLLSPSPIPSPPTAHQAVHGALAVAGPVGTRAGEEAIGLGSGRPAPTRSTPTSPQGGGSSADLSGQLPVRQGSSPPTGAQPEPSAPPAAPTPEPVPAPPPSPEAPSTVTPVSAPTPAPSSTPKPSKANVDHPGNGEATNGEGRPDRPDNDASDKEEPDKEEPSGDTDGDHGYGHSGSHGRGPRNSSPAPKPPSQSPQTTAPPPVQPTPPEQPSSDSGRDYGGGHGYGRGRH